MAKDTATKDPTKPNQQQMVLPAVAQPEPMAQPANEAARKYLLQAGWTEASRNERGEVSWQDPAGAGPRDGKSQQTVSLPSKDGQDPLMVSQMVCPPVPWAHPQHEAMNIQRLRDQAADKAVA